MLASPLLSLLPSASPPERKELQLFVSFVFMSVCQLCVRYVHDCVFVRVPSSHYQPRPFPRLHSADSLRHLQQARAGRTPSIEDGG